MTKATLKPGKYFISRLSYWESEGNSCSLILSFQFTSFSDKRRYLAKLHLTTRWKMYKALLVFPKLTCSTGIFSTSTTGSKTGRQTPKLRNRRDNWGCTKTKKEKRNKKKILPLTKRKPNS